MPQTSYKESNITFAHPSGVRSMFAHDPQMNTMLVYTVWRLICAFWSQFVLTVSVQSSGMGGYAYEDATTSVSLWK